MRRTTPVLLAVVLCAALSAPAQARLFGDDDEIRKQLDEMRNRVDTMTRNEFERTNRFEAMRAELNDLRGQLEVLQHRLDNMEQHQRDVLADFDRRLQALGGGGAAYGGGYGQGAAIGSDDPFAAFAGGGQPIGAAPSGNEAGEYEAALAALKAGKQGEALAAFNRFIASYPSSPSLPDAHFWAGTAAIQQRDIATAQNHYQAVLDRWPDSRMAPDAMLGLANTQQALGDHNGSRATLKNLVATYGDSNAAKIARDRLGR